jgi:hypothetical protein
MTLAEVMRDADPEREPSPNQTVIVEGKPTLALAFLDRTVVVEVDGERVLVRHDQVEVPDPPSLRWQPKSKVHAPRGAIAQHRRPNKYRKNPNRNENERLI